MPVQGLGTALGVARVDGLGAARIARLRAAVEVGRRYLTEPLARGRSLTAPADAARFFQAHLCDRSHEVFGCLFLDTRHRIIAFEELFRGTIDGATVYPRVVAERVFGEALAETPLHRVELSTHQRLGLAAPVDRLSVHRRARRDQARSEHFAVEKVFSQLQMRRSAEHSP